MIFILWSRRLLYTSGWYILQRGSLSFCGIYWPLHVLLFTQPYLSVFQDQEKENGSCHGHPLDKWRSAITWSNRLYLFRIFCWQTNSEQCRLPKALFYSLWYLPYNFYSAPGGWKNIQWVLLNGCFVLLPTGNGSLYANHHKENLMHKNNWSRFQSKRNKNLKRIRLET